MTLKGKKQEDSENQEDSESSLSTPAGSLTDLELTPAKKAPPKKAPPKKAPTKAATKKELLFNARMAAKLEKLTKKG